MSISQVFEESLPLIPTNFFKRTKEEKPEGRHGLNLTAATLFIIGEMAGSGVLALPQAVVKSGSIGLLLLVIFCFNAAYGGIKLGQCWNIVEDRFPEYKKSTRNPYAIIAQKAVGTWGSFTVSQCIRLTLFGAGTVYLLLSAQILQELLRDVFPGIRSCSYFVIIALSLVVPMWCGSPKEFSLVGIAATLTTVVACILYFLQISFDGPNQEASPRRVHDFHDFFLSFGTLLFAFGGASTFPTIQNDMADKKQFSKSIQIAFIIILGLYLPITAGGFYVYGEEVAPNFTMSLSRTTLVYTGNILMAAHLVFAFLIVINTVCQDVEESFNIPKYFTWKRCLLRTAMVVVMIFIGESIPQFGKILSLVGGSTITLLTFVFPPLFYMRLCHQNEPKLNIPLYEEIFMYELIGIGLVGGGAATYSAITAIFGHGSFNLPCYLS